MADDTGIIYTIAVGCSIFGIVTAYLIYNFVQQEKADYYKYKLRKEQAKKDPHDYDYTTPKEKKRKITGPIVDAGEEKEFKSDSRNGVPIPAPILAPVVMPPVPNGSVTPNAAAAAPAPEPPAYNQDNPPTNSSPANDFEMPLAAAAVGGAAGVGAFAAYNIAQPNPEPEHNKSPKNKKDKSNKKRKGSIKKVAEEDFDDYRNFSPTILPPPKGAPPRANYTGSGSEPEVPPQYSDDVQSVEVEQGRHGMQLPRVAIVNRDGLLF